MKDSIKYSLAGLVGAGIFAGTVVSNSHRIHEYQTVKNEMLQEIQAAEHRANDLDHKVDDCIKTVNDCRSVYAQYQAASDQVGLLQNKYALFEITQDTSVSWGQAIGAPAILISIVGLGMGLGSYLRERREKKEKIWKMKVELRDDEE